MEERHLNIRKVLIVIFTVIFALVIIITSAIVTANSRKKKEEKNIQKDKSLTDISSSISNIVGKFDNNVSNDGDIDKEENNNENNVPEPKEPENESKGVLPVQNPNAAEQIKTIYGSDEKQIYLTFDDGPSGNVTPQILDILREEGVPATFFILGSRAELYPELVKKEYEEGHFIANHGYSHKYSAIYTSIETVMDEYRRTELAIQTALGNPEFHSYLFRFPGGSSGGPYHNLKQEAKAYLWNNGIVSTNWNCLNGDAEGGKRTKEQLISRLYETAEGHTSLIILMHDADDKQTTADALREIIQNYKSQGYTFKNFYEVFK